MRAPHTPPPPKPPLASEKEPTGNHDATDVHVRPAKHCKNRAEPYKAYAGPPGRARAFRAAQHDRSRVAKIKHADAADARVQRARAPYASISSIMVTGRVSFLVLWGHWNRLKTAPEPGTAAISTRLVLDVCYAGSFVLWRPEDCPPQTPHWPTNPQLMLMMLARPAPKSTPEAITNSVLSDKDRRNKACWEHANSSIFTAFSPLSKAIKKGASSRDKHAKRGRPSAQSRSYTKVHRNPLENAERTGDEAGRRHYRHPGKAKALS